MTNLKRFFGLAAALVLALTVVGDAARAQTTVTPKSCFTRGDFTRVRSEGITEMVGTIVIRCDPGSLPGAANARMVVRLLNGVQVTNTIASASNKVAKDITLKLYDSPGGAGDAWGLTDGYTEGIDTDAETANGMLTDDGTVEFLYTRADTTADDYAIFRIEGIRINASAADGSDIRATITAPRDAGIRLLTPETITVADPTMGLETRRVGSAVSGLACTASVKANAGAVRDNVDDAIAKIEVKEGFNGAFKADEIPGDAGGDGEPDGQGTRIMLSFADVPNGVNVYLRPGDADNNGTLDETNGLRCDDDNGGDAGGMLALQLLSSGSTGATPDANNYVKVALSGGAGTAVYRVTAADDARTENCDIPIFYQRGVGAGLGTGTVSASFAPTSTSVAALVAADQVPRFTKTGSAMNMVTISECTTTLLFPFVTNQLGFDTGVVIANTSMDPFDTGGSGGTCDINYYGAVPDGVTPDSQTSDMVEAGGQLQFLVSAKAAGFQGYLMAECDFQFAHGLAYVTNNFGATPTVAHGYMALVVPVTAGDRGVAAGVAETLSY